MLERYERIHTSASLLSEVSADNFVSVSDAITLPAVTSSDDGYATTPPCQHLFLDDTPSLSQGRLCCSNFPGEACCRGKITCLMVPSSA